ncbi:MAG: hypothetical protein DRJ09_04965, partial [Bacteroidetes bacterium]
METKIELTFFFIVIFLFTSIKFVYSQHDQFSGHITSDTVWQSDTLEITGDVTIDSNVTLTVLPGTFVHVLGHYAIFSYGSIHAIGTINDSVVFTHSDTLYHNSLSTTKGGWNGIRLLSSGNNDTSIFEYCIISNGKAVVPGTPLEDTNQFNRGGNIYAENINCLTIKHCLIENGLSKSDGGGIYIKKANYMLVDSNNFFNNRVYYSRGGGACITKVKDLTVSNCMFKYNVAFWRKSIYVGGDGSGLAVANGLDYDAHTLVANNCFFNNQAWGASTLYESCYNVIITNNLICNNFGGGILNGHGFNNAYYTNNTIANNTGGGPWSGAGFHIFSDITSPYILNNIVWNNYAVAHDSSFQIEQIYKCYNCFIPDVRYSDVMYGYQGVGNINTDPGFVNPTESWGIEYDASEADWSLRDDSPLINAGVPDTTGWNIPATDLYGNPRIYGIRIDIGAIENQNVLVSSPNIQDKQAEWVIYPNPSQNEFRVKSSPNV